MGRGCTMDEWVHFERLPEEGRVPNSSYWYVHCRHCVRGYEQKQLINPPAKLTGRRSAMKAHLKVCPLYATQYKMEQRALAAAAAASAATVSVESMDPAATSTTTASTSTTPTGAGAASTTATASTNASELIATDVPLVGTVTIKTQSGEKRKRRGEDVEASGPRGGRGKHCMMEEWEHFIRLQDEGYIGKSNFFFAVCRHCQAAYDEAPDDKKPLLVPEKMVGRREKMRKHLVHCPHFKGELPSLERRTPVTPSSGPHAFLPLPTADGIKMVPASALASVAAIEAAGLGQASGAESTAAGEDAQPSARLALDEWQYFTRMQRKKDSAYYFARCNFCQQAFDLAPDALKASMTPTVVMGRKSNMQTHLAKCPYVPKDAVLFNKAMLAANSTFGMGVPRDQDAAMRLQLAGHGDAGSSASLHQILIEFLLQHALPFEWVDSLSAKKLLRLAAAGAHVPASLVPTSAELRGHILDDLVRLELDPELEKLKQVITLPSSPTPPPQAADGATVADDSASLPTSQLPVVINISVSKPTTDSTVPSIECTLSGNGVAVPLHYIASEKDTMDEDSLITGIASGVRTTGATLSYYHGLEVARFLGTHLRRVRDDHELAAGVVMVPPSPVMHRAVGLLRAQWPTVAFVVRLEDMVAFCLRKALQNPLVAKTITTVNELIQVPEIHAALAANGFFANADHDDWTTFASVAQELVSDRMAACHATVDAKLSRADLFRVASLLRALAVVDNQLVISGRVTLADTLTHLATVFAAADGFNDVQHALEVVWHDCEQPLYLLAHALHPHLRLRGVATSELTKFSVVSDFGVAYFTQFFQRKPLSVRGDVTSYLHVSQPMFAESFIAEFPLVDDYFRYLRDAFPELAALMQLLQSFSIQGTSSSGTTTDSGRPTSENGETQKKGYTDDEQKKLSILQARWGVEAAASNEDDASDVEMTDTAGASESTSTASSATSKGVVAQWMDKLDRLLSLRMVDFSDWEATFASGEAAFDPATSENAASEVTAAMETMTFPSQADDDVVTYVATPLASHRGKKVRLAQLFGTSESTTV